MDPLEPLNLAAEAFALVASTTLIAALALHPNVRPVRDLPGWRFILAGGACWVVGQFADFTDRFEWMAVTVIFGPTPAEIVVESVVGSVLSVILLGIGLFRWVPALMRRDREYRAQLKVLSGLLPVCASCKMIRDEDGQWEPIEEYIDSRSEATFSHSVCPSCARSLYGDYLAE